MPFPVLQTIGGDSVRKWESPRQNIVKEKVEKGLAFLTCYQYNGQKYYQKAQRLSDRNLR